jgi:hypothetical protein
MNTAMWFMLLVPIIGTACTFYFTRDITIGLPLNKFVRVATMVVPGIIVVLLAFWLSYGSAVRDVEVINGQVLSRERVHDTYDRTYDCMCSTDSKGNSHCSTCHETHYTVSWGCKTSVGPFVIAEEDSTLRSVYNLPNPPRWSSINDGDPVAKLHNYTNYIQAVPNSLYAVMNKSESAKFAKMIPPYPNNVFDHYRINRFVQYGFSVPDSEQWNTDISNMLRELGPKKQVNVIILLAKTDDPMYAFAVRDAWLGVKKNDVVLVIGSLDGKHINFTRVISWTKNELFKIELRDAVQDIEDVDRAKIISVLSTQIGKNFERRHMREFEYLKGEIDPPNWMLGLLSLVLIAGYIGATLFLKYQDSRVYRGYGRRGFNSRTHK